MTALESGIVIGALCPTRPINGSLSRFLVLESATSGLNLAATPQLPPREVSVRCACRNCWG